MPASRRAVLASLSAGMAGGLAGCLTDGLLADGTNLRHLILYNESDEERSVHLLVEADDELTHWSTTTIPAADNPPSEAVQVSCDWPMDVSSYRLSARVDDDEEWETFVVDEEGDVCRHVVVYPERRLGLRLETPCPPSDPDRIESVETTCGASE